MSFKQSFEKNLNYQMHDDGQPGRAPPEVEDFELDSKKKNFPSPRLDIDDQEIHDKKDRPPRFSTLFGTPPHSPPQREYVREYYPPPERKSRSGVFLPMPLFIVFAIILFFESTLLFAYTVIGLYNNAPSSLFPWAGHSTAVTSCECGEQQPSINFAPNFVIPQAEQPVTRIVTLGSQPDVLPTLTTSSTSTSSLTSSSTSSANPSSQAAAIASDVAGILGGLASSSSTSQSVAIVTVGPTQSTATSIKLITEDASGNVISAEPTPTVTQTTFVDPPTTSATSA